MKSLYTRFALLLSLFAIAACTSTITSDVSTFHEMTVPGGERIVLTPMREEKKDSLEFRQYASVLVPHLQSYGYKEAGDSDPQLIAGFDVTINDGREKLKVTPGMNPYWRGGWGWGRFWYSPYMNDPFDDQLTARTIYTVTLSLELRKPDGEMVYEGRAETDAYNRSITDVLPYLADALFQDFPGENGKTKRVVLKKVD